MKFGTSQTGVGKSVERVEDGRLLTGAGRYTDDLRLPGTAYGVTLRSPYGHAAIRGIDAKAARSYAGEVIEAFSVKATGPGAMAESLSGGNLQKYIMGREILQKPQVLVVSQPTWGVDAGAAAAIHQALVDLAARGSAIVVISQDLDELLSLCDTLAVINGGRLSRPMAVAEAKIDEIGLLMGGIHGDVAHAH
jgi:simple sugar transport system ATP-binding protein